MTAPGASGTREKAATMSEYLRVKPANPLVTSADRQVTESDSLVRCFW